MSLQESSSHEYELRGRAAIAGTLTEYDDVYTPGHHIRVAVNRRGRLDPVPAAELAGRTQHRRRRRGSADTHSRVVHQRRFRGDMEQLGPRIRPRYRPKH
jgi:hypothetical protein